MSSNTQQLDKDIARVLGRMGQLLQKYSVPYLTELPYGKYGPDTEFGRRWISPQAEQTYNTYVRILADLNERKMGNV